jgi:outer membrane protein OmpA-like peptidoglycan-associated protein
MKYQLFLLPVLTLVVSHSALAEDEYSYIETPKAVQIADLQDEDKDGVINARDRCANTPLGSEITNYGCGTSVTSSEKMQLKVLFAHDSSAVSSAFFGEIKELVQFLKEYPETHIEIQGHTSTLGSVAYNLNLSRERANQVRQTILRQGISPDRVSIVGYGESVIDREGDAPISHALNRRVTASVIGYDQALIKEWTIFTTRSK